MSDLSGRWTGAYFYPGSMRPFGFVADLRDAGGALALLIEDDPSPAHGKASLLTATASGARDGAGVRFTKTYDDLVRFPDPVLYDGQIDAEESEIAGRWSLPGLTGNFIMTRPREEKASETREAAEPLLR